MFNNTEQTVLKVEDDARNIVTSANSVRYRSHADPSLCTHRAFKNHPFLEDTVVAEGDTKRPLICKISLSGREFIRSDTSFLTFKCAITPMDQGAPTSILRWNSSVCDLFRSVRLTARDGTVLDYIENLDTLLATTNFTNFTDSWFTFGQGTLMGTDFGENISGEKQYVVPLRFLTSLASSVDLLPPMLLDGATLEITLQNVDTAIIRTPPDVPITIGEDAAEVTIRDIRLVTDTYQFDEKLVTLIQNEYRTNGIPIQYTAYTNVRSAIANDETHDLNFNIPVSASRATKAIFKMTTTTKDPKLSSFFNQYSGYIKEYGFNSIHAHHGYTAIPDVPITNNQLALYHWVLAFNKAESDVSAFLVQSFELFDSFALNLDRGAKNGVASGTCVSTKFPLRVNLTVGELYKPFNTIKIPDPILQNKFVDGFVRYLDLFLEHQRLVVCKPYGNELYL